MELLSSAAHKDTLGTCAPVKLRGLPQFPASSLIFLKDGTRPVKASRPFC